MRRGGLTLLEVILALGLFVLACAAFGHILWNGTRASVTARLQAQGLLRCETKLAEMLAGAEPLQSRSSVPFSDDGNWVWSSQLEATAAADLLKLSVTASHQSSTPLGRVSVTLVRLVRDPAIFTAGGSTSTPKSTTTRQTTKKSQ